MLAIYRYTFYKYVKSWSTWVILFFSALVIGFIIGGLVPFLAIKTDASNASETYVRSVISTTSGITVFLAIFASVFAGFKAATMYKDEVENGTFLTILSKPISRSSIILGKWLSLQSILAIYALISVFFFCLGVTIFDVGGDIGALATFGIEPLRNQIAFVGLFAFIIVYVACLIFSSIALILSTRISVAATIGIMIALGIVIPITSLLSLFLRKEPVSVSTSGSSAITSLRLQNTADQNRKVIRENYINFPNVGSFASPDAVIANLYANYNSDPLISAVNDSGLINLGTKNGEIDSYSNGWVADLNFHFSTLSQFAYERAIPDTSKYEVLSSSGGSVSTQGSVTKVSILSDKKIDSIAQGLKAFYESYDKVGSREIQSTVIAYLALLYKFDHNFTIEARGIDDKLARISALVPSGTTPSVGLKSVIDIFTKVAASNASVYTLGDLAIILNYLFEFNTFSSSMFSIVDIFNYSNSDANSELFYKREVLKDVGSILSDAEVGVIDLRVTNKDDQQDEKLTNLYNALVQTSYRLRTLISPLNFLIYGRGVDFSRADSTLTTLPAVFEKYQADNNRALKVAYTDVGAINSLMTNANSGSLVTYERGSYVSKDNLLIGYVVFALLLAPLTYPLIKRQDFR